MTKCSECGRSPVRARGRCSACYARFHRSENFIASDRPSDAPLICVCPDPLHDREHESEITAQHHLRTLMIGECQRCYRPILGRDR